MVHLRSYKWFSVIRLQRSRRQMFCEVIARVGRPDNVDHMIRKIKSRDRWEKRLRTKSNRIPNSPGQEDDCSWIFRNKVRVTGREGVKSYPCTLIIPVLVKPRQEESSRPA